MCFRKVHRGGVYSNNFDEIAIVFDKYRRQGYKEYFCDSVVECADKYQKPYQKMKPNERRRRITHLSKEVLSECVDTSCITQDVP